MTKHVYDDDEDWVSVDVELPEEDLEILEKAAKERGITLNEYINELLAGYLEGLS